MTIVHRPAAVSQPTPGHVTEPLVPVIVLRVGLVISVSFILMNVVPSTSVQTTQRVSTPTDRSTVSVIGATSIGLKFTLVKVFILFLR